MELLATILITLFSGGLSSLLTLRFTRQREKANARLVEATVETQELDNVQAAVKIWREMAESLRNELEKSRENYNKVMDEIESLRKQISRLTLINNKILKLLDALTPDNLNKMVELIKKEIHEGT